MGGGCNVRTALETNVADIFFEALNVQPGNLDIVLCSVHRSDGDRHLIGA